MFEGFLMLIYFVSLAILGMTALASKLHYW